MPFITQVQDSKKPIASNSIESRWLGLTEYQDGLRLQSQTAENLRSRSAVILGLEHPPVVTLGVRGDPASDFLFGLNQLKERGIQVERVERGGQATLHNPGQLVIYPICDLRSLGLGVREFLCRLQKITLGVLGDLGVECELGASEPGLFSVMGKIAAFGLRIQRGISQHGLAINVSNDLAPFSYIRNCGHSSARVARVADFGIGLSPEDLFALWAERAKNELPI